MRIQSLLATLALLGSTLSAQTPAPAAPAPPAPPAPPAILGFAVTGSTTLGSQYIFRGLTQTDGKPTVQAEIDLAHADGWYLSLAASNISWLTDAGVGPMSAGVEVDVFGGYKWGFAKDWTLDIGAYRYLYPGDYSHVTITSPSTTEGYLGLSYTWASLKYSRVLSAGNFGVAKADGSSYIDLSLAYPLGESGWTVLAHAGKTTYTGTGNSPLDYTDTKLGIAKELKGYTFALAGTKADTKDAVYTNALGHNIGGNRVTLTLAKTF
ncbi:MAG: TorF family putative porin [Acidobacteria bacterium]|nr:TorF family putative porin [Acidobacteriota bacterium]